MMNLQAHFSNTHVHVSPRCFYRWNPRTDSSTFFGPPLSTTKFWASLFFVFLLQYHCKIEVVALFSPASLLLCLASCVWVPGIPDRAGSFRYPFQRLNERKKQGRDEASEVEKKNLKVFRNGIDFKRFFCRIWGVCLSFLALCEVVNSIIAIHVVFIISSYSHLAKYLMSQLHILTLGFIIFIAATLSFVHA